MRFVVGLAFLAVSSAYGQYVISAHSGVIQLVDGSAYLDDKAVAPKFGQFPDIKQNQVFRTEEGRAEILLTPGVFLRMGENSSIRMVSNRLTDTRVEMLSGAVMLECDEIPKDNAILLMYKGDTIMLVKHGLYRLDGDPARLQVYDGEAVVKSESGQLTLKGGRETGLGAVLMAERFDKNSGDELYNWSSRRASYLAKANVSSAMGLRSSGGLGGGFGGWQFNPLFGLFTFVPYTGIGYSPWGYAWWSPYSVIYYSPYGNGYYGGGGGGSYTAPNRTLLGSGQGVFSAVDNGRAFNGAASPSFSRGNAVTGGASAPSVRAAAAVLQLAAVGLPRRRASLGNSLFQIFLEEIGGLLE